MQVGFIRVTQVRSQMTTRKHKQLYPVRHNELHLKAWLLLLHAHAPRVEKPCRVMAKHRFMRARASEGPELCTSMVPGLLVALALPKRSKWPHLFAERFVAFSVVVWAFFR